MRKLLTGAFIILSTIANAQQFIWVTDYSSGIPGVQKQINVSGLISGVTKSQLDSAVGNKALQSFVNNAVSNLQNLLAQKQNKLIAGNNIIIDNNNVISATTGGGGGSIPQITVLPLDTFIQIAQPRDYLKQYTNSVKNRYYFRALHSADNNSGGMDNRPDQPMLWMGYNVNPNNGRASPFDMAYDFTVEDRYYITVGGIKIPHVEFHWPRFTDITGKQHRYSIYASILDGTSFMNYETNSLTLFKTMPGNQEAVPHTSFANAQADLTPITGGGAALRLWTPDRSKKIELSMIGTPILDLPNTGFGASLYFGYNHFKIGIGTFDNDTQAKANGYVVGDSYWTVINGRKLLTQVQ